MTREPAECEEEEHDWIPYKLDTVVESSGWGYGLKEDGENVVYLKTRSAVCVNCGEVKDIKVKASDC